MRFLDIEVSSNSKKNKKWSVQLSKGPYSIMRESQVGEMEKEKESDQNTNFQHIIMAL